MGKLRKKANVHHQSTGINHQNKPEINESNSTTGFVTTPLENPFSGLNINVNALNKLNNDDVRSVRSFKSVKSQLGDKAMSKKDKMQLRKEMFMQKIERVQRLRKQLAVRKKRVNNAAIVAKSNLLGDALPSLEFLMKSVNDKKRIEPEIKKRGIEKAGKRKKKQIEGVKTLKKLLKDGKIQQNPLQAMTEHVNAILSGSKRLA